MMNLHLFDVYNSRLRYDAFLLFLVRIADKSSMNLEFKYTKKWCAFYGGDVPPTSNFSKVVNLTDY